MSPIYAHEPVRTVTFIWASRGPTSMLWRMYASVQVSRLWNSTCCCYERFFGTFNDLPVPSDHCCQNLSKEKQVEIQQAVVGLGTYWCESSGPAYLLVGDEVCTGLTNGAIEYIVKNFYKISTEEQLRELGVGSYSYCQQIISLLSLLKWTIIATIIVINFCINYRL